MDLNELLSLIKDEEMKSAVNTLATQGVDTLGVDTQKTMVGELRAAKAADLLEKLKKETQFKAVRKASRKALDGLRAFGIVPGEPKKPAEKKVSDILSGQNTVAIKPSDKLGHVWVLFNVPEKGGVGPEIPMLSMRGNRIMSMSVFESSAENARRIGKYIDEQGSLPMAELPHDPTAKFVLDALDKSQAKTTGFTIEHAAHIAAMFRPFKDAAGLMETLDKELSDIEATGEDTLANWEFKLPDPLVRGDMKRAAKEAMGTDDVDKSLASQKVMAILGDYMKTNATEMAMYFRFAAYSRFKGGDLADASGLSVLAKAMDAPDTFNPADFSVLNAFADRLIQAIVDETAAKKAEETKEAEEKKEGEQDEGKD